MNKFLRLYAAPVAIVVLGIVVAFMFMAPAPPKQVVIAAGGKGGAYAATAEAYAAFLRDFDIEVEVLETAGSVDNLARLNRGEADIAIVQTGIVADGQAGNGRSLGAVFHEPLWLFHRSNISIAKLQDLAGYKVAIGPEGSGVRVLAGLILTEAGVTGAGYTPVDLAGQAAATALQASEVDAALIVSGATAPYITALISDPQVKLMSMSEAHALARRHPYLDEVDLYRGVLDLAAIQPREDVLLIAPAAQIVVREDLHTAVQSLLIEAAVARHGGGSLLSDPGRFPTLSLTDIPVSDEAKRYYEKGPSFLRSIFPYSVANFLERTWVLAIPLITLMIPLVRAAPPIYRWRIRRKIYVWYKDLRDLENAGRNAETVEERMDVRARLADLQAETGKVEVPVSYTDDLYRLRAHIRFVAELVERLGSTDRYARV